MTDAPRNDADQPLVLRNARMLRGMGALFAKMKEEPALQNEFIENPSAALYAHVTGETLPPQRASVSNQLLFSILGNEKIVAWLRGYAAAQDGAPPSRDRFMADFSGALVEHGGDSAVLSLIKATLAKEIPLGLGDDASFLISSSPIIASGFAVSTDQKQQQSQKQDQSAAQDLRSSQNFEQSTQQDTPVLSQQDSSGLGYDPDIYVSTHVRATIEALVSHATRLEAAGLLSAPRTRAR